MALLDVRQGEWRRLIPLTLTYGLVLASVYVLKPVRNALFLDQLGVDQLPYVLMLVAVIGGTVATFYSRFTESIRIDRLLTWTFVVLIANLLVFRWLFTLEQSWVYYLFYVWVNVYGLLAVSMLWLLANAVFNPREARRLFGLIGSGGIGGAIIGGTFTGWAGVRLGTESLIFVCIAILAVCAVLVQCVQPQETEKRSKSDAVGSALSIVRRVELLRLIAWMAAIAAIMAAVIDVQFNHFVDEAFPSKDAKTAFFGSFFAYLNVFAFLFQLFLTPRILRVAGIGTALFFLPIAIGAGSLTLLLLPGLIGGIAVKVGDLGFRHSIHKSAMEILYLPIPSDLKNKAKVFLDATVDNVATGAGAVLVLVLTGVIGASYESLGFLLLGLVVVWSGLLVRTRRAYVDAFRQALDRREIDFEDIRSDFTEASVEASLMGALHSDNERHILYALETLNVMGTVRQTASISSLLDHASPEIRERALLVLSVSNQEVSEEQLAPRLDDIHFPVRVEAAHVLIQGTSPVTAATFLAGEDPGRRLIGLGYVSRYGSDEEKAKVDPDLIESLLEGEVSNEAVRTVVARSLGNLPIDLAGPFLDRLKTDPSESVVRETILSLGKLGRPEDQSWLVGQLGERRTRSEAREALSSLGADVLDALESRLDDVESPRVRNSLPRVLGQIPSQRSADILAARLGKSEPALEFQLVKALNKLRQLAPDIRLESKVVQAALLREIEHYFDLVHASVVISQAEKTQAVTLLLRTLDEKADQALELVFRLLGLQYPPRDVYHAYLGIVSPNKTIRASAIEFLDNILERDHKEALIPFLETGSRQALVEVGNRLFGQKFWSVDEALAYLIQGDDEWVRVCAIHCVKDVRSNELVRLIESHRDDPSPLIAETVALTLTQT